MTSDNQTTIEPLIEPLVAAINRLEGCQTLYSCEGHVDIGRRPYVTFSGPVEIARRLSGDLHAGIMCGALLGCWIVSGSWPSADTDIQWILELSDSRVQDAATFWALSRRRKLRKVIDADCATLVRLISRYRKDTEHDRQRCDRFMSVRPGGYISQAGF